MNSPRCKESTAANIHPMLPTMWSHPDRAQVQQCQRSQSMAKQRWSKQLLFLAAREGHSHFHIPEGTGIAQSAQCPPRPASAGMRHVAVQGNTLLSGTWRACRGLHFWQQADLICPQLTKILI